MLGRVEASGKHDEVSLAPNAKLGARLPSTTPRFYPATSGAASAYAMQSDLSK